MIFRRNDNHTVDTAIALASHAIRIVYGFKHNKKFTPTELEIEKFEQFEKKMWQHYCTARHVLMCMYQRTNDRPEAPHDWHDREVRDMKDDEQ